MSDCDVSDSSPKLTFLPAAEYYPPLSILDCRETLLSYTRTIQQGAKYAKFQLGLPSRALHSSGRHCERNGFHHFHVCKRELRPARHQRKLHSAFWERTWRNESGRPQRHCK